MEPTTPVPAAAGGEGRSPLSIMAILDLLFRPSRFFSPQSLLSKAPEVYLVAWVSGIAYTMGKVDTRLMRSEVGAAMTTAQAQFAEWLTSSWPQYWMFVLGVGAVNGLVLWYVGGWWYRKRLEWSGADHPDLRMVRPMYMYQDIVMSAPVVLITIAETVLYANYADAWEAENWWVALGLIFIFWSCATSYKAATSAFTLTRWKAHVWFIVLPLAFYFSALAIAGALLALAEGDVA